MLYLSVKKLEEEGKFAEIAKLYEQIAKEYHMEKQFDDAILSYKKAYEFYEKESKGYKSKENECRTMYADLLCITNHENAFNEATVVDYYILILLDLREYRKRKLNE